MTIFEQALELKSDMKDLKKSRKNMIADFCLKETSGNKGQDFKNLRKEVSHFADLKDKIRQAEAKMDDDPIAKAFTKVNETIALLRDMGKKDLLNKYLVLLSSCDVILKDENPLIVNPIDELEKKLESNMDCRDQNKSDMNTLKEKAEEEGLCSKTRFNKLIGIIQNSGKEDTEDKIQEEYLLSGLITKGADAVSNLVKGNKEDGANES